MPPRFTHLLPLTTAFEQRYGQPPSLAARAPGRVNLIGEHTDYNGGWVLPAAISFELNVVCRPRTDSLIQVAALDLSREAAFALDERQPPAELWLRYPQGVAVALQEGGWQLRGMDAVYGGNVPIGAGLSSSAAVAVAFAEAYATVSGLSLSGVKLAFAAHRAENEFVGVHSGIMDQFIAALGRERHALLLNCATLEYRYIAFNLPGISVVVLDSGVHRELARSEYERRRVECQTALQRLRTENPALQWLAELSPEELEASRHLLDALLLKRVRHVVEENARTLAAAAALEAGDAHRLGTLMRASHESLRDLYEVSSPELNALAEIAWSVDGVIGARMTGAGFGGAVLALAATEALPQLQQAVNAGYPLRTGRQAEMYVCDVVAGAESRDLNPPSGA